MLVGKDEPIVSISERFRISRTATNKYLAVLSDARLVSSRGVGREDQIWSVTGTADRVEEWLSHYEQFCDKKLTALKGYLEHKDGP